MITYSGSYMFPHQMDGISLIDIAISLGRMPRFAGHTNQYWPVLAHLMVCLDLAKANDVKDPELLLNILLHDAHEAIVCDLPRPWKDDARREMESRIQGAILEKLGVTPPDEHDTKIIKLVDNIALSAEEIIVGPPGAYEYDRAEMPGIPAIRLVEAHVRNFYNPTYSATGTQAPAVARFVQLAKDLLKQVKGA